MSINQILIPICLLFFWTTAGLSNPNPANPNPANPNPANPNPDSYFQDTPIHLASGLGRDHARLDANQSVKAQEFIQKFFQNHEGQISLEKIDLLLIKLRQEKDRLVRDLFESTVLERVEVDVYSQAEAREEARKQHLNAEKISNLYDRYLIPTIEELKALMESGQSPEKWEGYIHDFVRAYHVFYSNHSQVTAWRENDDFLNILKGLFVRRKFRKNDPKKNEAINLIVEKENLGSIQDCLESSIQTGHYLTRLEIEKLKNCNYDLSTINPGISGLWERRSTADIQEFKSATREAFFPIEGSTLLFKEVMLTGGASPKIKVKEKETGRGFKIKWGIEAHVDQAIGNILHLLGFNADLMQHRSEIKVHLGDQSYEQFISLMQAKYPAYFALHRVLQRGGLSGEEWIILKDVLVEAHPEDDEIKTLPFDPTAADFNERREFNGRLLFLAWVNLLDGKIANMKMLLASSRNSGPNSGLKSGLKSGWKPEDDPQSFNSRPRILFRMKDLGFALGASFHMKRPQDFLYLQSKYIPELFEEKGIVKLSKKKNSVSIRWNDVHLLKGIYQSATYSDLKWMARKIASLSGDDLEWSLIQAGMPVGVAKIYRAKLISRRNEIIQAFELSADPDFHYPEEEPDLSHLSYQGNEPDGIPEVRNGKVVRSHFTGKQVYYKNKSTVLHFLIDQVGSVVDFLFNTLSLMPLEQNLLADRLGLNHSFTQAEFLGAGGRSQLDHSILGNQGASPITFSLGVGITGKFSRRVLSAPELHTDYDSKSRAFQVRDTLAFTIGLGTPALAKLIPFLPLQLDAGIKVLEVTYEFDHFAEDYLEGFRNSLLPFLKSIVRPIEQAAMDLDRTEVIRRSISFGFETGASVSLFKYFPVSLTRGTVGLGRMKIDDRAYFRDQYGHLHVLTQKSRKDSLGVDTGVGETPGLTFYWYPFLGYRNSVLKFKTEQRDLVAMPEQIEYSSESPIEDNDGRLRQELKIIQSGKVDPENLSFFKQNFKIQGTGTITSRERIGFFHGNAKDKRKTVTEVSYPDGHLKKLILHSTRRDHYLGIPSDRTSVTYFRDMAMKDARRVYINVEVDDFNPSGSVAILKVLDFYRHRNREDVLKLIQDLNQRFSIHPEVPFYRNFELPDADDVNDYRRVYGTTRIYLSTAALLDKIVLLDPVEFKSSAENFFSEKRFLRTRIHTSNTGSLSLGRFGSFRKTRNELRLLMKYFKKLKREAEYLNRDHGKISVLVDKFLFHQKIHKYGTSLLLELLGEDGMFVTGDIGGIFPSFSTANVIEERQHRRFVAYHWGSLSQVAPIQLHNRVDRVYCPSLFVPVHIDSDMMFGAVTNGYPEEMKNIHQLF